MDKENFNEEQLDEVSKKTLASYVKKASSNANDKAKELPSVYKDKQYDIADEIHKKIQKRESGINSASKRLNKESTESLSLLIKSIEEGNTSSISALFDKIMNEKISELVEERKKEIASNLFEEEQLDELSKNALGAYIKKSKSDFALHSADFGRNLDNPGQNKEDARKMMRKRSKGIDKAVDRLTKESVEELSEISKETLKSYINKASGSNRTNSMLASAHSQQAKANNDKADKAKSENKKAELKSKADASEKSASSLTDKTSKRAQMIKKAASKFFKEEHEQLDELSKDTLKSYKDKATNDAKNSLETSKNFSSDKSKRSKATSKTFYDKFLKRNKGINKASERLSKE